MQRNASFEIVGSYRELFSHRDSCRIFGLNIWLNDDWMEMVFLLQNNKLDEFESHFHNSASSGVGGCHAVLVVKSQRFSDIYLQNLLV